jgi:DNA-binding IclR family transcriptional regulator
MSSITAPVRRYKVTSLERGLTVLRALRDAEGPVRNQDVVARTGLPKATVSRLMHTLSSLGYLRRTDQGSYVLRGESARPGRAMVEGLRLERHEPLLRDAIEATSGTASLETRVGRDMAAVFRWSGDGGAVLSAGAEESLDVVATMPVSLGGVGEFALTFGIPHGTASTPGELGKVRAAMAAVAAAMEREDSA